MHYRDDRCPVPPSYVYLRVSLTGLVHWGGYRTPWNTVAPPAVGKTGQRAHRKSSTKLFLHRDKMPQRSFGGHYNAYLSLLLTDNAYLVRRCSFMHDATGCASKNVAGKSNAENEGSAAASFCARCTAMIDIEQHPWTRSLLKANATIFLLQHLYSL